MPREYLRTSLSDCCPKKICWKSINHFFNWQICTRLQRRGWSWGGCPVALPGPRRPARAGWSAVACPPPSDPEHRCPSPATKTGGMTQSILASGNTKWYKKQRYGDGAAISMAAPEPIFWSRRLRLHLLGNQKRSLALVFRIQFNVWR